MEKGDKVKIKLEISESHDLRGDLNALSKRKYLSVKQKEERYYLQKFLSRRDQKLDWIEKTLERTFVNTRKINLVSSPDDWMQVISGILERTTQVEVLSGAIKLDLWQEEPCQLNAPVYISDEDMDSLLRKLDLPDSRALAVGKGGGYYAIDLPRKVLLKKAIPAIAVSVHEAFEAKTCSSNDIETQYGPSNWYMGLG